MSIFDSVYCNSKEMFETKNYEHSGTGKNFSVSHGSDGLTRLDPVGFGWNLTISDSTDDPEEQFGKRSDWVGSPFRGSHPSNLPTLLDLSAW